MGGTAAVRWGYFSGWMGGTAVVGFAVLQWLGGQYCSGQVLDGQYCSGQV